MYRGETVFPKPRANNPEGVRNSLFAFSLNNSLFALSLNKLLIGWSTRVRGSRVHQFRCDQRRLVPYWREPEGDEEGRG